MATLLPVRTRHLPVLLLKLRLSDIRSLERSTGVRERRMAWAYLTIAGIFEIGWAVGLKYSDGFSKPVPTVLTVIAMGISLWMLSIAMKTIPIGTAYAVWTGIGAVGVAMLGMLLFGESREVLRVLCLFMIVAGIVGLKLIS